MAYQVSTYDFASYELLIDGVPVDQFADGTVISIKKVAASNDYREGAKGDGTFIKSNSRAYTLDFNLKQVSTAHLLLVASEAADINTTGGIPAFAILLMGPGGIPAFTGVMKINKDADTDLPGGADNKDEPVRKWTLIGPGLKTG